MNRLDVFTLLDKNYNIRIISMDGKLDPKYKKINNQFINLESKLGFIIRPTKKALLTQVPNNFEKKSKLFELSLFWKWFSK
jgi:hypothetical protein